MPPKFVQQAAFFMTRNPLTAAATITAAAAAPFFVSDDQRGYLRTALMTTPVILVAGATIPRLIGNPRDIARAVVNTGNKFRQVNNSVKFTTATYNEFQAILKNPLSTRVEIEHAIAAYLVKTPSASNLRKIQKEKEVLDRYFYRNFVKSDRLLGDKIVIDTTKAEHDLTMAVKATLVDNLHETKGRLISNALHEARRSSLTPEEWAVETADLDGVLTNDEMIQMYEGFKNRDDFTSTLTNRLREVKRLNDTGLIIDMEKPKAFLTAPLDSDTWWKPADKAFFEQRPGVMKDLQTALKKGYIQSAEITAEDAVAGGTGRVLNIKIYRKGNIKPIILPIVDPASGSVRLPNAKGVGNRIFGPDYEPYYIDEWVSKLLAEGTNLPDGGEITNRMFQEDIKAHTYYLAGDPLDAYRMAELTGEGEALMSDAAIKLRSHAASASLIPLWRDSSGRTVNVRDLDAFERLREIKDIHNTGRFISMGSEGSEFRFQLREAANLSPLGAPSAERQDPLWRSITKDMTLKFNGPLPEDAQIKWSSTAWQDLMGTDKLSAANFNVASIASQDRMFFADLPSTQEELMGSYRSIVKDLRSRGMSKENAASMFEDIRSMYSSGDQALLKDFGRMGETGFILDEKFASNFTVEAKRKYKVDILSRSEGPVGVNDVLGFRGAMRVKPEFAGEIDPASVAIAEQGRSKYVTVISQFPMQGAKLDMAGVKGMVPRVNSSEGFNKMRGLLNTLYAGTGRGTIPETINTLAPMEYYANKVEPTLAYLGISGDLLERLPQVGAGSVIPAYLDKLAAEGITSQLVIDASKNPVEDEKAAARLIRFATINEEFFEAAGTVITNTDDYLHDPVLSHFATSGMSLRDFYMTNYLPSVTFAWDHSLWNRPSQATLSHDIQTYMLASGNYRALKEVNNRVRTITGGDASKGVDFLKYVMGGDYSQEHGVTVSLHDAFRGSGSIARAKNRDHSIFDPSIEAFQNDFRLDLGPIGPGGTNRYLPVPGTSVYGAEAPMFAPGEYQKHEFQEAIHNIWKADTPKARNAAADEVLKLYPLELGTGNHSVFRPKLQDPYGATGFLSTSAEKADPFVARVSPEWVASLHDKAMREALNPRGKGVPGEGVYGMLLRQPTQETFHLRYVMDNRLKGTYDVAVDEMISRAYSADQDKDPIISLLWKKGSDAEKEAIEEIANDNQLKRINIWKAQETDPEIAREVNTELKNLYKRMTTNEPGKHGFAEKVYDRISVARNRTAIAETGAFSNVLTSMMEQIVSNPILMRDPDRVSRLRNALFEIRQAPISAGKAKASFDLVKANALAGKLRYGLGLENNQTSFKMINSALVSIATSLKEGGAESKEAQYLGSPQGIEDMEAMIAGRSELARIRAQVFTTITPRERGKIITSGKITENAIANIRAAMPQIEEIIGAHHGGRMATEEASKIGRISEYLAQAGREASATATGRIGKIFAEHGKSLAIGAGALAALGVVLTPRRAPMAKFNRTSSNAYRPENQIGVSDNIPGEPVSGQMAPSNPPRRMAPASTGTRTAVIAPMSRTSDLSVKTKAVDRDHIAETIRQISQIPGGDTNVTVNYKDNTKLGSLRLRDRIRDILR